MARTRRRRQVEPAKPAPGDLSSSGQVKRRSGKIVLAAVVLILLVTVVAGTVSVLSTNDWQAETQGNSPDQPFAFVGSETCAGCHEVEADLWRASHHRHAMAHASEDTVLGDFSGSSFEYFGVRSRFFRQNGKFMVETDGPDGSMKSYEIKYTFGIEPLQQYLIELSGGRVQALSIAWDTRPRDLGGQRWFHLYPDEKIGHDDDLHWTRLNQNWNFMCAECHSTGVRKNYDPVKDQYNTQFAEISVGCESCHGQGSGHVAWAQAKQSWWPRKTPDDHMLGLLVRYAERLNVHWTVAEGTATASRSMPPAALRTEVETCGLCHARRGQQVGDWLPGRWLSQTHGVSRLERGLYDADGQMRDEVFNYGSFKQSRMFTAGVTCSDCHDPHSAKPRLAGDGVCLQCHAAGKYSAVTHHRHENVEPAPSCASCHMPVRTYMVVDRRHDHSFRVPRPDLSVSIGTANACNDCHTDKTAQWAADAVESWFGPTRKGFQTYGPAFHAAWTEQPDATQLLAAIAGDPAVPAIARATALGELSRLVSPALIGLAQAGLNDADPMVRIGALDMIEPLPVTRLWELASPLLADPVRGVRIRAVQILAAMPANRLSAAERERFEQASQEFVATQRLNADRPEARTALGAFLVARGKAAEAETEFKSALKLSPHYAPAVINLADLYRLLERDGEGEALLQTAVAVLPGNAGLHHALGLTLVRLKRVDDAIAFLKTASELEPENARYGYVYGVALHSRGNLSEALQVLQRTVEKSPNDRDTLIALIQFLQNGGDEAGALKHAEQLSIAYPADQAVTDLIASLRKRLDTAR